ncbi:DNA phosphorothioation-dependent restriction protein DptF [Mucilaginibacter gossypii]|uniref:DNA phosphorothioation-dependent restriction protein DptF n=1 Tax=Mucilaginibacter gossypii TaxID=551996 RepID=UPI000DCD1F9C|nr:MULTISPECIES: DNA phosphorothioation-dependent restriction protein DptF [Mucilaginibacter]QTE36371.1 DNA phosphorothioation-dependent restriction protein DptF [Mucilaginibacter gossypii]RAV55867.1 DNA phosphorothioation-dependent restriction protein DptF [Mucilaginibacter rubeus]
MQTHQLITQLGKLKESAKEAIANANTPIDDDLKNYLHISRPVEQVLTTLISEAASAAGSALVLVCGNVGDGKSHLLARLRGNEMTAMDFSRFHIHNDATESYSPEETCNDTLSQVLRPFSDAFLGTTDQKVILAINLGTLSNFLEERKGDFSRLKRFVERHRIIEADGLEEGAGSDDHIFRYVNFTNYHFYSLRADGPQTDLIETLLNRIVDESPRNPIARAYHWVCEQPWSALCPIKTNFELLRNESTQKVIANLLVACLIKEKQIISFRQLLNFVHDLLVPYPLSQPDVVKYLALIQQLSEEDRLQYLSPYYLFENPNLSKIFYNLHQLDPAVRRYEALDERAVMLFTDADPLEWLNAEFAPWLGRPVQLKPNERIRHELIIKTFLRLNYFKYPSSPVYHDDHFLEYTQALFTYNNNDAAGLRNMIELVKKAAYSWNGGTSEKNKAIVPGTVKNTSYRVFKQLGLRAVLPRREDKKDRVVVNEFSQEITLKFGIPPDQSFVITIDYSLYVLLQNVNAGYRPNKIDRHTYINFARFVEQVTFADIQGQTLYIDEINFGFPLDYKFEFNEEYQEFTFSKLHRA